MAGSLSGTDPSKLPLYYVARRLGALAPAGASAREYHCERCGTPLAIDGEVSSLAEACAAIVCAECAQAPAGTLLARPAHW